MPSRARGQPLPIPSFLAADSRHPTGQLQQHPVLQLAPATNHPSALRSICIKPTPQEGGASAELRQPLGIAVLCGLLISQILTLYIT